MKFPMSHKTCKFAYFSLAHLSFASLSYRAPTGELRRVEGKKSFVSFPTHVKRVVPSLK